MKAGAEFQYRHGDEGRDLALYLARRYSGLTLAELGARAGGLRYAAIAQAIRSFRQKLMNGKFGAELSAAETCLAQKSHFDSAEKPIRNAICNDFQGIKTQGPCGGPGF